ncbi:ribonuclease HII [Sodiomyces alkalinus F11]|uniref:Ribonuclease n=1 Tax=Sodiomyces alkalinus (strain CBS 110278 / VKM F-3762 / F11) TaxID=1314773 RepID=A0A3N2Q9Z6_SODAK|nr:ribonuclease HII [Sodiomyces alkalinus F11]ROT43572.1 ribonuclease HII [Sodiomyces alkalinus F11]
MEDVSMKEDIALETPPSTIFIPPSVDQNATLAGDSYTYYSPIPPSLLPTASSSSSSQPDNAATVRPETTASPDSPLVFLGIDEAGRGPVLGPMVYSAFYVPVPLSDPLLRQTHRFDDSKALTPAARINLMRILCDPTSDLATSCGFAIRALSARDIAAGMLSTANPYNLNAQAFDATVEIIRGVIARGVRVEEIFVDTVGQPAAYQAKLQRVFPGVKITVAKKADSLYPCVSAASVCAKVTRDAALEVLYRAHRAATMGEERGGTEAEDGDEAMAWGSGYPSDARCVTWLKNNMHPIFGWGPECRFSWGTAKDMVEGKNGVKVEWPVEDDGETNRMTDYFVSSDRGMESDELGAWFGRPAGVEAF